RAILGSPIRGNILWFSPRQKRT
ncbi:hypothetical protein CWATWH0003_1928b6, partial [Crocosphaera watsonii WH 0003]